MIQTEYYMTERRNWWERLFSSMMTRAEGEMEFQLPPDSLFAGSWAGANSVADVPEQVKAQIQQETLLATFTRLESSLRLLLYATTPGKEPPTAEDCHQILNVWRYELEHRVNLTPDTYCGAVQKYESDMETAYTIDGRCSVGDLLRIRVPCWRMHDRVVIRGEAEVVDAAEQAADEGRELMARATAGDLPSGDVFADNGAPVAALDADAPMGETLAPVEAPESEAEVSVDAPAVRARAKKAVKS